MQSGFDRSSSESFYSETGDIPGSSETRDLCHRSSLSAKSRMDSEKMLKRGKSRSRLDRKRETGKVWWKTLSKHGQVSRDGSLPARRLDGFSRDRSRSFSTKITRMHFGELSSRDSDNKLPGGAYESRFFVILRGARGLPARTFRSKT